MWTNVSTILDARYGSVNTSAFLKRRPECSFLDSAPTTVANSPTPRLTIAINGSLLKRYSDYKLSAAVFIVSAASLLCTDASSTNLYVSTTGNDSNSGMSSNTPLRTIQRAASVAKPGTTVYVAPGSYVETIKSVINGTSTARIRFVSSIKHGAILKPATGAYTMWAVEGGYTDIEGFQLNGTGSTTVRIGIYMNGGNSSVRTSWIHNIANNSGCDNRGGGGIVTDQSRGRTYSNYSITDNKLHNIGGGCGYIQGIYHNSSGVIINNTVSAASQGINLGHDNNNTIIMHNNLFNNAGYGVRYGGCKEAYNNGCPTRGIKVHNNRIYANGGGIQGPIASEDVGNSVADNQVYANGTNFDLARPRGAVESSKNICVGESASCSERVGAKNGAALGSVSTSAKPRTEQK